MGKKFSLVIARRLRNTPSQTFSRNVTWIAISTIALGITILTLSFAVLRGFQEKIYQKIFDYNGHIQIQLFVNQKNNKSKFFDKDQEWIKELRKLEEVDQVVETLESPSLVISNESMQGIVIRTPLMEDQGVSMSQISISEKSSQLLKTKINQGLIVYFMGENPLPRKVKIQKIYHTGLEEIDQNLAFTSTKFLRKALNLKENEISGLKLFLKNSKDEKKLLFRLKKIIPPNYLVQSTQEIYPGLFDWMKLLDRNIILLIGLLGIVAGFNIIASLYILMIERIPMIGVLKSMGASQTQVKNIFLWNGAFILLRGLFIGNLIGLLIAFLQDEFQLIPLNEKIYYMPFVPIYWSLNTQLGINICTIVFVLVISLIPTRYLDKLNPLEAINFKN